MWKMRAWYRGFFFHVTHYDNEWWIVKGGLWNCSYFVEFRYSLLLWTFLTLYISTSKVNVLIISSADLNKPQGIKQIMEPKDPSFEDESLPGAVSTLSLSLNMPTQVQTFNRNGQRSILLALPTEIRQLIFMHVAFPPQRNARYNPK